jgi:hypothetical protein
VSGAETPNVMGPSGIAGHFFDEAEAVVVAPAEAAVVVAPLLAAVVVAPPAAAVVVAPLDADVAELLLPLLSLPQAAASRALAPRTAPSTRRE